MVNLPSQSSFRTVESLLCRAGLYTHIQKLSRKHFTDASLPKSTNELVDGYIEIVEKLSGCSTVDIQPQLLGEYVCSGSRAKATANRSRIFKPLHMECVFADELLNSFLQGPFVHKFRSQFPHSGHRRLGGNKIPYRQDGMECPQ